MSQAETLGSPPSGASASPMAQAAKRISFVGPLAALIFAGLSNLIDWTFTPYGYVLLASFAGLGFLLGIVPQKLRSWQVQAESSEASLKQMVGTLRVLVAIVLVAFPLGILSTNKAWLAKVPQGFNAYVTELTDDSGRKPQILYIKNQPKNAKIIYVVRLDQPEPGADQPALAATPGATPSASAAPIDLKLYAFETEMVLSELAEHEILPRFHALATFALVIASIFVFAIFLIEMLGDMMRRSRA